MNEPEWRSVQFPPTHDKPVLLGWLPNGRLEHSVVSRWAGNRWRGGYTPTHWRPLLRDTDSRSGGT